MPAKGASASARSPFVVGLYETDTTIEYVVLASFAAHVILTLLVMRVAWSSWLTAKLRAKKETPRSAATLLAAYAVGFVHALVVSAAAIAVTVFERYDVWPPTLAYSLGYFLSDFCFYAAPTLNFPIVIHHIVMVVGHYPVMEREAATLYGAGDAHLITWLSACGYLTEISNLFLDVRWYQLKVQPRTPSNGAYALNAAVLLLTYVLTRIVIMPWVRARALGRERRRRARRRRAPRVRAPRRAGAPTTPRALRARDSARAAPARRPPSSTCCLGTTTTWRRGRKRRST